MVEPGSMGEREREILTAIVETFISTGEPVGSRVLARGSREGLSAATVRNVMADLSDAGFLEQPHTSAGRVPTSAAYRYYVEQLTGKAQIAPADANMIQGVLQGISNPDEFMERTSHVLSLISHSVGVTMTTGGSRNALDHVYFSRLAEHKVLAVVVTRAGVVRDRVLRMSRDLSQADLDSASRYINENFRGWTLETLRTELARRIEQERSEYDRLMQSVEALYREGALEGEQGRQTVWVEGTSNLVVSEEDRQQLRDLLKTLEEKEKLAELLSAYLNTREEAVRVIIGLGENQPHMSNLVLIGAPARVGGEVMGSLAVIGPTRIDYEHTITAVSYIARLFDRILNDAE